MGTKRLTAFHIVLIALLGLAVIAQSNQQQQAQGGQSSKYNDNQQPPVAQQQVHQQPPVPQQQVHQQPPPVPQQQQVHQQPPPVPQQQQVHQQPPVPQQQVHQQPPVPQEVHQQPPVPQQVHQQPPVPQQVHQQPPVPQQQVHQPPPVPQQVHQQPPVPQQQVHQQPPPVPQQQQMNQQPPVPQQQFQQPPVHQQQMDQQQHQQMHQQRQGYMPVDNKFMGNHEPVADEPVDDRDDEKKDHGGVDFNKQKDVAFHFILPAKEKQCFYYPAQYDFTTHLEVVRGSKVDFYVNDQNGKTLHLAQAQQRHSFEVDVDDEKQGSTFLVCVDNRKDSWTKQQVELNFMIHPDKRREILAEMVSSWSTEEKQEALQNIRSKRELIHLLETLNKNLDQTEELQSHFRRLESHDRGIMEDNFTRVNTWSIFQLVVMVSVGFLQVFMIRSLFDERSAFHRLWKR